jgi:hypothetical protein
MKTKHKLKFNKSILQRGSTNDWMESASTNHPASKSMSGPFPQANYDPDQEFLEIQKTAVKNPVISFAERMIKGEVMVEEAWLFEGKFNQHGKLMREAVHLKYHDMVVPYRVRYVKGAECQAAFKQAESQFVSLPEKVARLEKAKQKHLEGVRKLQKAHMLEDDFSIDTLTGPYDANQYTEFVPTYGGPFNKQLYIYDYLTMHARAFEAWNHNPVAKRIVNALAQYAFGRRFKVRIKKPALQKAWDDANKENKFIHKASKFWSREYIIYGELMVDKLRWDSIDPSTVWDIITDPDDIGDVYYYYQSYPTAFQTFTGYQVAGAPGSAKQEPLRYIIRQLPAKQVLHIKSNVVSQEKRGRSSLFAILGWLKRIKDLYNAEVIRAQLEACFIWDDTIDGSASDVASHAAAYASMPKPASIFVHNKAVERKAMQAISGGSSRSSSGVSDELLAFIATAIGMPKDFFNVLAAGGGNRATALVAAEPFEKVIEDLQADFEHLFTEIAYDVFDQAGVAYEEGDVEFLFPSVTKDTTSETVANVNRGEVMGYIDHQTAAEMYAAEMNITNYDYEEVQDRIKQDKENGIDPLMPPIGRSGGQPPIPGEQNGSVPDDASPIHGTGKKNLKGQLKTL